MSDYQEQDLEVLFQDKVWRMTNLYSISTKAAEKVVFLHNNVQVDIQKTLDSGENDLIILKARQHGVNISQKVLATDLCKREVRRDSGVLGGRRSL